jgi:hypothetical protein
MNDCKMFVRSFEKPHPGILEKDCWLDYIQLATWLMILSMWFLYSCKLLSMFVERQVSYSISKQKMASFRGQARWAKMMSPEGKLTALVFHPTKKVNKAEELTIDI